MTDWLERAVFYQIYPRSFSDANGDGIGDLRGIVERLDYLQWLGVDAIWLSPHYPSPLLDCGYDIADYTAVAAEYGTLNDFAELIDQLHRRDMRLIIDVVLNHTSDQHLWFQESRRSTNDPKRDWYIWHDGVDGGPPNNWESGFGGSAWTFDEPSGQYYYHYFLRQQPDLNWRNPAVHAAMFDAMRFWLDLGVDGFRLDAVGTIYEREDLADHDSEYTAHDYLRAFWLGKQSDLTPEQVEEIGSSLFGGQRDLPEVHDLMSSLRQLVANYPDAALIGEAHSPDYLGSGSDQLHAIFNFNLLAASELTPELVRDDQAFWLSNTPAGATYGNTLNNHDQSRAMTHYGNGVEGRARVSAAAMLTLVGVPFLYYGEEIGMEDYAVRSFDEVRDHVSNVYRDIMRRDGKSDDQIVADLAEFSRDRCRTPMQWNSSANGGFSPEGAATWLPIHDNHLDGVNVEAQRGDEGSLLSFYRELIHLRRNSPALHSGTFEAVDAGSQRYLAFRRSAGDETLLVLINFEGRDIVVECATSGARVKFGTYHRPPTLERATTLRPFEVLICDLTSTSAHEDAND